MIQSIHTSSEVIREHIENDVEVKEESEQARGVARVHVAPVHKAKAKAQVLLPMHAKQRNSVRSQFVSAGWKGNDRGKGKRHSCAVRKRATLPVLDLRRRLSKDVNREAPALTGAPPPWARFCGPLIVFLTCFCAVSLI